MDNIHRGTSQVPYILYQSVDLLFDFPKEDIIAKTTLWLTFSSDILPNSFIYLHCRHCNIKEVLVNGIPSEFILNDALQNLTSTIPNIETKPGSIYSYSASEFDSNYRSALEISKQGELRIKIPSDKHLSNHYISKFTPIPKLPLGTSKDVISRYDGLQRLYEALKPKVSKTENIQSITESSGNVGAIGEDDDDDDDHLLKSILNRSPAKDYGRLLQIQITYSLTKNDNRMNSGYVFRKSGFNDSKIFEISRKHIHSHAVCAYSINGYKANQTLYNVDGVRCWLPCLDLLEQRSIFDMTIHAPSEMNLVALSGRRVSRIERLINNNDIESVFRSDYTYHSRHKQKSTAFTSTRFFTPHRVNACVIGFFVGTCESYQMPLYRCRGRIHMTLNLADYDTKKKSATNTSVDETNRTVKINNLTPTFNSHTTRSAKKLKFDHINIENGDGVFGLDDGDFEAFDSEISNGMFNFAQDENIYEDQIRHSLLGFDMAIRFIHKIVGRRYQYESYTQVYVPGLSSSIGFGSEYLGYDGFSLVDSKYLHDTVTYLETANHLVCLEAYLSTYISVCLPVQGYFQEYLIHGIVGYLMHLYIESVYGEEESVYNQHKCFETVINIEKLTTAIYSNNTVDGTYLPPLASISFPDGYERYLPWYGTYFANRSLAFFHIVDSRVGGSDPIRKTLHTLLRAPSIINQTNENHTNSAISASVAIENNNLVTDERTQNTSVTEVVSSTELTKALPYVSNNQSHYDNYVQMQSQQSVRVQSVFPGSPQHSYDKENSPSNYIEQSPTHYMSSPINVGSATPGNAGSSSPSIYGSSFPTYYGSTSPTHYVSNSPAHYGSHSPTYYGSHSPTYYGSHSSTYYYSNSPNKSPSSYGSPMYTMNRSHSPNINISSPEMYALSDNVYFTSNSPNWQHQYSPISNSASPSAQSPYSFSVNQNRSGETSNYLSFPESLTADFLTGEIFCAILRSFTNVATAADFQESDSDMLLKLMVYSNHTIRGKFELVLDPKIEGKPRNMHLFFDPIILTSSSTSLLLISDSNTSIDTEIALKFRIGEYRDERTTEPSLSLSMNNIKLLQSNKTSRKSQSNHLLSHTQAIYSKPGRRGGSFKKKPEDAAAQKSFAEINSSAVHSIPYTCLQKYNNKDLNHRSILIRLLYHFLSHPNLFDMNYLSLPSIALYPNQIQILRKHKLQIIPSLLCSREMDYPIKYCLFDPFLVYLSDVNISSLPDHLLIAQLFLDLDMFDIIRQIHALRGLSTSLLTSSLQTKPSSSSDYNLKTNDKSPSLQFHALVDCLLGTSQNMTFKVNPLPTMPFNSQAIPPHSIYVRVEAAFSLMMWQYQRLSSFPVIQSPSPIASYSLLSSPTHWEAALVLLKCLNDLFFDVYSVLNNPVKSDDSSDPFEVQLALLQSQNTSITETFTNNELLNYLKYNILHATSLIKTKHGVTPIEIVQFYINLASKMPNLNQINAEKMTTDVVYTLSHILLCMSRFVFDSKLIHSKSRDDYITIIKFALEQLSNSIMIAVTAARVNILKGNRRRILPRLSYDGLLPAAALTCLGQMDRQIDRQSFDHLLRSYDDSKSNIIKLSMNANVSEDTTKAGVKEVVKPSTIGIVSGVDYSQFFLPPGQKLLHSSNFNTNAEALSNHTNIERKQLYQSLNIDYLSSANAPLIRLTALEAFVNICISSYASLVLEVQQSQLQQQMADASLSSKASSFKVPDNSYVPAAIEAVLIVIKFDNDLYVKQQAALILLNALQDVSPKVILSHISLGYRSLTFGYSDNQGYSFVDPYKLMLRSKNILSKVSNTVKSGMKAIHSGLKLELTNWWKVFTQNASCDQVTRSILLATWLHIYSDTIPKALLSQASVPDPSTIKSVNMSNVRMQTYLSEISEYDKYITTFTDTKPSIKDPFASFAGVDMRLNHGSQFVLTQKQSTQAPQSATLTSKPQKNVIDSNRNTKGLPSSELLSDKATTSANSIIKKEFGITQSNTATVNASVSAVESSHTSSGLKLSIKLPVKRS